MDTTDKKLLALLLVDSRVSLTQLAKKANISREVATYRLERFVKKKLIQSFITRIDIGKLGFTAAAFFVDIKPAREVEFEKFLDTCPFISWVGRWTGKWSHAMSIVGKSQEEVDDLFRKIYNRFKEDITQHHFIFHKNTKFFHEKYLGAKSENKKKEKESRIDEKDKHILKLLSLNARVEYAKLATTVGLTAPAIAQRIKKMKKTGIIEQYSVFLDLKQLKLQQYSIFVDCKAVEQGKLSSYLTTHSKVSYVADYYGDPFLEFGLFVGDSYQVRPLLREIEEAFPGIKVLETIFYEDAIQSIGPPPCVFD